jgi:lysophospholipase L1-like esterase
MKRVLCYGDSNTWGCDPATDNRFDDATRWTRILAKNLPADYEIIEEGLNGRTTVWNDPIEGYKNGAEYLVPCLESHRPFDLIVLMLGTNDLKKRFSLSAFDIAEGIGVLVRTIQHSGAGRNGGAPKILVMAPPPVGLLTVYEEMFEGAKEKSYKLAAQYQRIASETGCAFFDTASVIVSSNLDGIHFEATEHQKLGVALAAQVIQLVGQL